MDIFNVLTMIGGLCLFLFGMNLMGDALERRAGSSLRVLLGKLTTNRMLGFLTGLAAGTGHQCHYGRERWNHRHRMDIEPQRH